MQTVAVVIPTKNRPEKLRRCLDALAVAIPNSRVEHAYVCDSSTNVETRDTIARLCADFPWAKLAFHDGTNVAAARNACARAAAEDVLINVDDDVYVEPPSLGALIDAYDRSNGARVVAGSVAWDNVWSQPVVMRPIGYGRSAQSGEQPSFLIGAFFLYPRQFALTWPWNEHIRTSDDRFMGALWRSRRVKLLFEPQARAVHDSQHSTYGARDQHDHIYTNLYDTLIANPNLPRALCYEFGGFLVGLRRYSRSPEHIRTFVAAWLSGNVAFFRDRMMLRALTRRPIPAGF